MWWLKSDKSISHNAGAAKTSEGDTFVAEPSPSRPSSQTLRVDLDCKSKFDIEKEMLEAK